MPENKLYTRDENGNYHELFPQYGYVTGQTVMAYCDWLKNPVVIFEACQDKRDGTYLVIGENNLNVR